MLMTDHPARDEATALVCHGQRLQPYRFIHKGLRALMLRTLQQAGQLDATHADERQALVAAVEELLQVCADHVAHENTFFHAPLRERAPRAAQPFDDDHQDHLAAITALRLHLGRVATGGAGASAEAYALYLALTRFVADNLEHMADEETLLTRALWTHFSDAEIAALEERLRATFTPHEQAYYMRWMLRGLNHGELEVLVRGAREAMPEPAFDGLCTLLREELPAPRWARLAQTVGVALCPGLVQA